MKDVLQTLRDYEAKTAEIARLNGEITARELTVENLQDEVATLTSKNKLAARAIEGLKVVQKQMKDSHAQVVRQIETENGNLNDALDEVYESNLELGGKMEVSEKEKQQLQDESASLRAELDAVKDVLRARFPDMNPNLDNLSSILDGNEGNETGRRRRKRRCAG